MSRFSDVITHLTEFQGSTRSSGLLRCLWGLILWARWANELLPFQSGSWDRWLLSVVFFVSTTGMVIGYRSRASCFFAGLATLTMVFYYGHERGVEPWTHHHTTFLAIVTFVLCLTPSGRSFSLDRILAIRRAERSGVAWPREWGNLWGLRLVALQLSAIYFWGAMDKSRMAFLGGDRIEQPLMYLYFGSDYPGEWLHVLSIVIAVSTVSLEYVLTVGLWFRRIVFPLMVLGVIFHAAIYYFLPVSVFSVASIAAYLAYMPPSSVHRFFDRLLGSSAYEE